MSVLSGELKAAPTVLLHGCQGLSLIVPATTGITYVNQTGGHACYQCEQAGYLVPIGLQGGDQSACDALLAYFTGPKWSGWCHEGIDAETADEIDRILADSTRREGIVVDRSKLNNSWEAWVHVCITEPLVSLVEHASPSRAILTWPNSD